MSDSPNRATLRRKTEVAFAHRRLANEVIDSIADTQAKWNAALAKLDADGAGTPAVAATAILNLTADITLTSVAAGAARNTETLTLQVAAAAANPTDTILADFTGTAAAIILTITPNDGTNNGAVPVNLTTAELAELINTGAVVGKNVTVTDGSGFRILQTASGGDATNLADAGEGDGVVATFSGGANAVTALDTDYEATLAISDLFEADDEQAGAQHKASLRKSLRSALSHKKLADEIADAIEEMQAAHNAAMAKLDAQAGLLVDTDWASSLGLSVIDAEAEGSEAQHKASFRISMRSAMRNRRAADQILDALMAMQESFNSSMAQLDLGNVNGAHAAFAVSAIDPDAE